VCGMMNVARVERVVGECVRGGVVCVVSLCVRVEGTMSVAMVECVVCVCAWWCVL
jgi:hypothetical protein